MADDMGEWEDAVDPYSLPLEVKKFNAVATWISHGSWGLENPPEGIPDQIIRRMVIDLPIWRQEFRERGIFFGDEAV